MTTENPLTEKITAEVSDKGVGCRELFGVLENHGKQVRWEKREQLANAIDVTLAIARLARSQCGDIAALQEAGRAAIETMGKDQALIRELMLEVDRARAPLRDLLMECFDHLRGEIARKTLNESARDGTQTLSRKIAEALDSSPPNTKVSEPGT